MELHHLTQRIRRRHRRTGMVRTLLVGLPLGLLLGTMLLYWGAL